ncbi:GtrA family protein [Paenibacillus sp. L3-i20]|uniref:GtrA family protein n=1 Tax=Paenibacillus sp. L3-i20 TaxID=2905833 RepID=UPI001EE01756|nr:GtrA family protein [Paenibacillus sp. L3-i20]GKU80194.1 cell wall teichoic acid glycosylation protein GtcA [Paenibacillus sp. L3-i20]
MLDERRRKWLIQFIKFSLIGVLNTTIDFLVFMLLVGLNVHYAGAQAGAYLAGMTNSYIMNSTITFRAERKDDSKAEGWKRRLRFLFWNGVMLTLSVMLIAFASEVIGLSDLLAKAIVTALIVVLNFYGTKRWVFVNKSAVETG